MSAARFECLDAEDPAAVEAYERAFHAGFARVTGNRLIRSLWRWDDAAGRLATRIPYADQVVFLERGPAGEIETAVAANVALRDFQGAAFGFRPAGSGAGCCELLTFFSVGDRRLPAKLRFWEACFDELRRRGHHTAFATTAPRPLPSYLRMGGELLEAREVEGEMRYFLRFSLDRHWIRRRGEGASKPSAPVARPRG